MSDPTLTQIAASLQRIADRLEVERADDSELNELERDVAPEAVLQELAEEDDEGDT